EAGGSARPLAGGTDLVVQMKERATRFPYPVTIVSLDRVSELRRLDFSDADGLRIGAGATMTDVATHPAVRERYTALAEGAGLVGSLQTMNMATIGGNVCNAAPSADTVPPLLVYEAEAVIVGPNGRRTLPLAEFFRGPGETVLAPDELLAELRLPVPPAGTGAIYERNTPRKQMDIAVVGAAVALTLSGDAIERARVALGAVAPTPLRARSAEAALQGQTANEETFAKAAEAAVQDSSPITDIRASAEYRRRLVKVMTTRLLAEAIGRARE
ncbi:MAG: xanthine dehydrogenase family protein subunit M, partial [Alphaproteobacteria bacterium]